MIGVVLERSRRDLRYSQRGNCIIEKGTSRTIVDLSILSMSCPPSYILPSKVSDSPNVPVTNVEVSHPPLLYDVTKSSDRTDTYRKTPHRLKMLNERVLHLLDDARGSVEKGIDDVPRVDCILCFTISTTWHKRAGKSIRLEYTDHGVSDRISQHRTTSIIDIRDRK